jgi:hypothetical protein
LLPLGRKAAAPATTIGEHLAGTIFQIAADVMKATRLGLDK